MIGRGRNCFFGLTLFGFFCAHDFENGFGIVASCSVWISPSAFNGNRHGQEEHVWFLYRDSSFLAASLVSNVPVLLKHTHTHIYQFKCDNKWSASVFRCMLWKESIVMCERSLALSSTTIIIPSGLIINTQLLLCGIESVHLSQTLHSRGIFF